MTEQVYIFTVTASESTAIELGFVVVVANIIKFGGS
jgi:hypothetical protein